MQSLEVERRRADQITSGEYGATRVLVHRDGSMLGIAFGRSGATGETIYYGAMLLSPEAAESLIAQLGTLDRPDGAE